MNAWTSNAACRSHGHCLACRTDDSFRDSVVRAGMADERDFACPEGYALGLSEGLPEPRKSAPAPAPVPRGEWPFWARWLGAMATESDAGIGDTFHRLTTAAGGEQFKAAFKKVFGRDCGCDGRRAEWNQLYPISSTST